MKKRLMPLIGACSIGLGLLFYISEIFKDKLGNVGAFIFGWNPRILVYVGIATLCVSGIFVSNKFGKFACILGAIFTLFFGAASIFGILNYIPGIYNWFSFSDLYYAMAAVMLVYLIAMFQHRYVSKAVPWSIVFFFAMTFFGDLVLMEMVEPLLPTDLRFVLRLIIYEIEYTAFMVHGFAFASEKFKQKGIDEKDISTYFSNEPENAMSENEITQNLTPKRRKRKNRGKSSDTDIDIVF